MEYKIIVAGIGPGNPDYMLPAAVKAIQQAAVLVGSRRALKDFARPDQATFPITGDIPGVLNFIKEQCQSCEVVIMVFGDPGYYSLLDALRREFPASAISVIPGISSVQFAFARLALPWHDARLLSLHGRRPSDDELRYAPGTILGLLTDTEYTSRTIPALLMSLGWPESSEASICARLSYEDETIVRTTLKGAETAKEETHCIMVVRG